ncbi:MAG: hypothetical protein J6Z50_00825 [Fibrobacterales bacterium]|nr:hypothetical protein [Fibrobacterales bacterium]MBP5187651.1 hypothetical protein [Fibrobacterales bacterium]
MLTKIYCPRCGTLQSAASAKCLLCGETLPRLEDAAPVEPSYPRPKPEAGFWTRMRVWRLFSAVLLAAATILLLVDFLANFELSWAQWPLSALLFAWTVLTLLVLNRKRPERSLPGIFLALCAFLALLDGMDGEMTWAAWTGIPIAAFSTIGAYPLFRRWPPKAGEMSRFYGFLLGFAAVECLFVDAMTTSAGLSWSLIVAACVVPLLALIALYNLERQRWERFFKI